MLITCDHLIPTFFWSAPSRRDSMSGACFRDWGPAPYLSVASTAAPLESKSSAAATWPQRAATWSGVQPQALFPGKPSAAVGFRRTRRGRGRGDDGSGGNAELHPFNRQTNDECFGLHIFKTACSHSQTHWTSFNASFLQHHFWWKKCNTNSFFNDDEASKDNVINKVIRLSEARLKFSRVHRRTMHKKALVTSHPSGRVHFCCDILSCLVLHDALKGIHLIPRRPPSFMCSFPSDRRGKWQIH